MIYFIDLLLLICYLVRNYLDNRICLESSSFVFDPRGSFLLMELVLFECMWVFVFVGQLLVTVG